jgi:predicted DNA-binding transcriptional regulator AlpA
MMSTINITTFDRIIRWKELSQLVPYSAMHIRRLEKLGRFPERIKLGVGKRAAVGWSAREVIQWISTRKAAREGVEDQLELPLLTTVVAERATSSCQND